MPNIEEPKMSAKDEIKMVLKDWGLIDPEGLFPEESMEKEYEHISSRILGIIKKEAIRQGIKADFQ